MTRGPIMPAVALLALLGGAHVARGDAEEASLHLEVGPAILRVEDTEDIGASDTVRGGRFSLRGSYGITDHLALDIDLGMVLGNDAKPGEQDLMGRLVGTQQNERAARVQTGVTARLGVRWIPTLSMNVGYQHRWITGAFHYDPRTGAALTALPDRDVNDLLGTVGAGLDYRMSDHWVVGFSVQFVHAFSLNGNDYDAVELPIHIAYYWYPRWFGAGWVRGGEPLTGP